MGKRRKKRNREKSQEAYIDQEQPPFMYPPSFPRLTHQQRELLFKLVNLTKQEGTYMGEFWWRSDPDEPNIVTQIKPRTTDGNFDPDNPMFQGKEWKWVAEQAQMEALDRFRYIVISDEKKYGSNREKWKHFAVSQLGFDLYTHAHHSGVRRFLGYIWDKAESHMLAFLFGILGALAVELINIFI
jgi:hypothetical protein